MSALLRKVTDDQIKDALRYCQGRIRPAARLIGVSEGALRWRMKKAGLDKWAARIRLETERQRLED